MAVNCAHEQYPKQINHFPKVNQSIRRLTVQIHEVLIYVGHEYASERRVWTHKIRPLKRLARAYLNQCPPSLQKKDAFIAARSLSYPHAAGPQSYPTLHSPPTSQSRPEFLLRVLEAQRAYTQKTSCGLLGTILCVPSTWVS